MILGQGSCGSTNFNQFLKFMWLEPKHH